MGFNLPIANAGAGAPEVEDGLALLRFDDLVLKEHPDWAGTDKFGKADDGQRFHFCFTLCVLNGKEPQIVYADGDPVELEALTRTATGEKSNFRAILAGLLTPQELAAWEAATPEAPFDGSALPGRYVHGKISHNKRGWPVVESVIGLAKIGK